MEAVINLTARDAHKLATESREGAEDCLIECLAKIKDAAILGNFELEFPGFRNLAIKSLMIIRLQKAGFTIPDPHKQSISPKSPLVIKW